MVDFIENAAVGLCVAVIAWLGGVLVWVVARMLWSILVGTPDLVPPPVTSKLVAVGGLLAIPVIVLSVVAIVLETLR
jgi:hypothetical protein